MGSLDDALIEVHGGRCIRDTLSARTLFAPLAVETCEVAAFAYLDDARHLLGLRHARSFSADTMTLPVRTIAADALAFGAAAVLMAHNHPSGDPEPSVSDRNTTRRVAQLLQLLDIRLLDHLVLTRDGYTSFHARGWL